MADQTAPQTESSNQLIVALAIVAVLGLIGVGLIIGGIVNNSWAAVGTGIGAVVGALSNALSAPSGIGSVIKASKAPPTDPTQ